MITIKELKEFLGKLPDSFDSYTMSNGEVAELEGEFFVRLDKPVIHLEIDEQNKEMLILNQSAEEIDVIKDQINKDTEDGSSLQADDEGNPDGDPDDGEDITG